MTQIGDIRAVHIAKALTKRLDELAEVWSCDERAFVRDLWGMTGDMAMEVKRLPNAQDYFKVRIASPHFGPDLVMTIHEKQEPEFIADCYFAVFRTSILALGVKAENVPPPFPPNVG